MPAPRLWGFRAETRRPSSKDTNSLRTNEARLEFRNWCCRSSFPDIMPQHCWTRETGNLAGGPGSSTLCVNRHSTLAAAQRACVHTHSSWCAGITQDSGILCDDGISKFDLRSSQRIKGAVPMWILHTAAAAGACLASEPLPPPPPPGPEHAWQSSVHWDPAPLPWGWWLPAQELGILGGERDAPPVAMCDRSKVYVRLQNFGRTNNNLMAWAHGLELVAPRSREEPITLVLSNEFESGTAPWFDWREATRHWACVITQREVPTGAVVRALDAPSVFFLPQQPTGALFVSTALSQLLLRPLVPLRTLVRQFEARHPHGYDGVHLRTFDQAANVDKCATWVTREALQCQTVRARDMPGRRNVTGVDICTMSDAYLRGALSTLGRKADVAANGGSSSSNARTHSGGSHSDANVTAPASLPLLVAHDGGSPARLKALRHSFGAVEAVAADGNVWRGPGGVFIDMLLLLRARVFIANPGSTVSQNVASVRSLVQPAGTTSMRPCAEALQGAAQHAERVHSRRAPSAHPQHGHQQHEHANEARNSAATRSRSGSLATFALGS